MAIVERAHPEHPDFRPGKSAYKRFVNRYKQCLPHIEGKRVLDVPCGTGWGTSFFTKAREVHGLDRSSASIDYATARWGAGIQFQLGDMCDMPYMSQYFDTVTCLEGYEHLDQPAQCRFMLEARRVLRVGGTLIMTVPLAGYSKHNPYHLHEPTEDELRANLKGFEIKEFSIMRSVVWFVGENR